MADILMFVLLLGASELLYAVVGPIFWLAIIPTVICAIAVMLLRVAVNRSTSTPQPGEYVAAK